MLNSLPGKSPAIFKLLGHDLRWQLLNALARSDCRVQELVQLLARPQNLVSYHLRQLRQERLVQERRSSADSRDVYYHLDLARLQELFQGSGQLLHPALCTASNAALDSLPPRAPWRILFLCTQNSARSQMAEGLLRARSADRVQAFSAGSQPGTVHPLAVSTMAGMGIDISGQRSKHLDEFAGKTFDRVITVCDRMRELCPVLDAESEQLHWSIPDPADVEGPYQVREQEFQKVADELSTRIRYLLLTLDTVHTRQSGNT